MAIFTLLAAFRRARMKFSRSIPGIVKSENSATCLTSFFFSTFPYMMACSKSTLSCFWWDVQDIVILLICPYLFTGLFFFIGNVLCPEIFWRLFDTFKLQSTLEKRTVRQMDAYPWLNLLSYYSFSLCTNYLFTAFFVCIFISTKMLISARNVFRRNSLFFEGRTELYYLELKTFFNKEVD